MVKALRMSVDEYERTVKRIARAASSWMTPQTPLTPLTPTHKNTDAPTHKFHAKPCDGYASTREAKRAAELRMLAKSGAIQNLREQVAFLLIPEQKAKSGRRFRACSYIADFVYEENGETIVEDVKGVTSGTAYALYVVKSKLMLERHGLEVREINRSA